MVEKGVPLGRSGGVVDSSGGENYPSAVATEAAEHPQNTDEVWVEYEVSLRQRLTGLSVEKQREILSDKKQVKQNIINESRKEILVLNKLLEELEKLGKECAVCENGGHTEEDIVWVGQKAFCPVTGRRIWTQDEAEEMSGEELKRVRKERIKPTKKELEK